MEKDLENKLADLFKEEVLKGKPTPSFEEVFQKTLDITTPEQAGDLRQTRKYKDSWTNDEFDEWV